MLEYRSIAGGSLELLDGLRLRGVVARVGVKSHPLVKPGYNNGRPFCEVIPSPDSFVLADNVSLYIQHEKRELVANTRSGLLTVQVDADALRFEATLPDTQRGRDAYELVRVGVLPEMSFGFHPLSDQLVTDVRYLHRAFVREISIVEQGQYPETVAEARSLAGIREGSRARLRLRFAQ